MKFNPNKYKITTCSTFIKRLTGFMFKKNIDYGLCFPKCNSIHTFFVLHNLDVIMCDKQNNIIHIFKDVKKNKIILPKKNVYYTYEFKSNTIKI